MVRPVPFKIRGKRPISKVPLFPLIQLMLFVSSLSLYRDFLKKLNIIQNILPLEVLQLGMLIYFAHKIDKCASFDKLHHRPLLLSEEFFFQCDECILNFISFCNY